MSLQSGTIPGVTRPPRPYPVSIRFSEKELEILQRYAEEQAISVSTAIRQLAMTNPVMKKERARAEPA